MTDENQLVDAATFDMVRELVKGPSIHGEARMSYSETTHEILAALQCRGWQHVPPDCVVRPRKPTKNMLLEGEIALENAQDASTSSAADGNRYDYNYFVEGTSGAVLSIYLAMIKEESE